ncbi:hypothetical protein QYE76_022664 [Lolium multiflorum]|uniref:CCHC-type domain-containing protein n=1 Tax=Lolium multiflorum TaxID=4521 RepID=A0AAD8VRG7_LOLMU|nr:hypothetical protein QYE76_022664 [Lolium multiflorum]
MVPGRYQARYYRPTFLPPTYSQAASASRSWAAPAPARWPSPAPRSLSIGKAPRGSASMGTLLPPAPYVGEPLGPQLTMLRCIACCGCPRMHSAPPHLVLAPPPAPAALSSDLLRISAQAVVPLRRAVLPVWGVSTVSAQRAVYRLTSELEARVTSLKKDLVKGHEGKQFPNDKSGLGFNSNNKNKSTMHKRKKGHGHVKDPAKIVCFKCKIEGHHVRSCPLKKKPLGEKKQGKRPQDGAHGLPQGQAQGLPRLEERPLPKKDQAKAPVVEKSSEKKEKRRTCYICREKGHISSFCTIGNSSNPILIDGAYSLCKDKFVHERWYRFDKR